MVSMNLVWELLIGACIFSVLWWGLKTIAPPEPINKVLTVVLVVLCVMWLINLLLGLGGHPLIRYH